ncbi:MAG: aminodeoxychorismate synthase component I [Flavobacteriaceae bacterium]|nr:aminodeoxychorismate synthase component I [Flavobacteriaceae bacterium]
MGRIVKSFRINTKDISSKLLEWSKGEEYILWLDSNNSPEKYSSIDKILAIGKHSSIVTDYKDAFAKLDIFITKTNDYIFGGLSYDLKNGLEDISSNNKDSIGFADMFFFQPKKIIKVKGNSLEFMYLDEYKDCIDSDFDDIVNTNTAITEESPDSTSKSVVKPVISKSEYIDKVERVRDHIKQGDVYEVNLCQEFYKEEVINPLSVYTKLNTISSAPFASYIRWEDKYILSASPERFVKKVSDTLISQPIKGTKRRGNNIEEDNLLRHCLSKDIKERAENIMIVDLVRNDLSKIAAKGSVKVEELCEIYSFAQVHQMISTITAKVDGSHSTGEILKSLYPMGSMTGAPKLRSMQIIEELEQSKRGIYSGSVGYISPSGDFDFSVIIRSILYNAKTNYVSFSVGGAITYKSIAESEYEECLVKAKAMEQVLR